MSEKIRYVIGGGIAGNPFTMRFMEGKEEKLKLTGGIARELHTKFMNQPVGPIRDLVVQTVYEELMEKMDEQEGISELGEEKEG